MSEDLKPSGFTPGPWSISDHPLVSHIFDSKGPPEGYRLADVHQYGPKSLPRAVRQANARLIAGAPDMYAALVEIARLRTELSGDFSMGSRQSDIARKTLSAIAKATGQ